MIKGIDHVVIACEDPEAAASGIERVAGLRATGGGVHETLGTVNRLVWLGDSYIELLGIVDPGRAATSWLGAPTSVALEAGGGFVTFALSTDDLEGDVGRLRRAGSSLVGPLRGERRRPDGRVVRWSLAHPPRLAPDEPPFLIEHDESAAEWTPADREERAHDGRYRRARCSCPRARRGG